MTLSKKIFFLVILLIPLNLGKHFVHVYSYVSGLLVDYLVPVIYVQDILIIILMGVWLYELIRVNKQRPLAKTLDYNFIFVSLFVFSLFLSSFLANKMSIAFYYTFKTLLYICFYVYSRINFDISKDLKTLGKIFFIQLLFLCLLSYAQFVKQASVFNNYLFFGEQPYSASVRGVNRESFFGHLVIPSYGTFRHPNILGGYIDIILISLLLLPVPLLLKKISFVLGLFCLFCTFSLSALLALLFGIILVLLGRYYLLRPVFLVVLLITTFFSFVFPYYLKNSLATYTPSISRRADLLLASYKMIKINPLYGIGPGNFTNISEKYTSLVYYPRFVQPVHNFFILMLVEYGFISFGIFLLFLYLTIKASLRSKYFYVPFLVLIFLGLFDHYLLTMPQTALLFWLFTALVSV